MVALSWAWKQEDGEVEEVLGFLPFLLQYAPPLHFLTQGLNYFNPVISCEHTVNLPSRLHSWEVERVPRSVQLPKVLTEGTLRR